MGEETSKRSDRTRGLSRRQRAFLREKVLGLKDEEAALAAGYALSVARNTKLKLWSKPQVRDEFESLKHRLRTALAPKDDATWRFHPQRTRTNRIGIVQERNASVVQDSRYLVNWQPGSLVSSPEPACNPPWGASPRSLQQWINGLRRLALGPFAPRFRLRPIAHALTYRE